jgi:hypothetical protein
MLLICNRHSIAEHSLSGKIKQRWKCKQCDYLYSRKYLENLKIKAIKYGGGECRKCGYDKCWSALHFHHIDPKNKEFAIFECRPGYKKTRNWDKLKVEIDKCILLCANCHTELHSKDERQNIPKIKQFNLTPTKIESYNKFILKSRKTVDECLKEILSNPENIHIEPESEEKNIVREFYKDLIIQLEKLSASISTNPP